MVPPGTVLTPHPGEFARLTGLEIDDVQANRLALAGEKAAEWGCTVVLKGAFTVIAAPDGRIAVLPFASAALASAGTGDVLAGAIVGLRAQGLQPFEAAVAGSWLHGLAGLRAAELLETTASVTAGDVLELLPEAVAQAGDPPLRGTNAMAANARAAIVNRVVTTHESVSCPSARAAIDRPSRSASSTDSPLICPAFAWSWLICSWICSIGRRTACPVLRLMITPRWRISLRVSLPLRGDSHAATGALMMSPIIMPARKVDVSSL